MRKPSAPNSNLYPELSEATKPSEATDQGVQFRLNKISEIRDFLENEVDQRDKLRRKYKTVWNVCYNTAQVSGLVAVGSGGGAVGNSGNRNRPSRKHITRGSCNHRRRSQRSMHRSRKSKNEKN